MSRKSPKPLPPTKEFGKLPSFLTPSQIDAIKSGTTESFMPVPDDQKPYLEWLAESFNITPAWKKEQSSGAKEKLH